MEKQYKNKNMVRTYHPVNRIVMFDKPTECARFMSLYQDKFDSMSEIYYNTFVGSWTVCIHGPKAVFDEVAKDLGLKSVIFANCRKTRYWKFEGKAQ